MDEQRIFLELTSLRGRPVKVSAIGVEGVMEGVISYVSFDSFLLETKEGNRVITFGDLASLEQDC